MNIHEGLREKIQFYILIPSIYCTSESEWRSFVGEFCYFPIFFIWIHIHCYYRTKYFLQSKKKMHKIILNLDL